MLSLARKKGVLFPAATLALLFSSCTAVEDSDTTNTFVYVTNMQTDGGADMLMSDVCRAGGTPANPTCSVVNDNGAVTVTALPKDQLRTGGPLTTQLNTVYFARYRVTYTRADGRGVPGVDVPYPFDGATDFSVTLNGTTTKNFLIVRQQAKLESPLINLQRNGQGLIISVLARVDFYGNDGAGRPITVTGYLNISFADFPDT